MPVDQSTDCRKPDLHWGLFNVADGRDRQEAFIAIDAPGDSRWIVQLFSPRARANDLKIPPKGGVGGLFRSPTYKKTNLSILRCCAGGQAQFE